MICFIRRSRSIVGSSAKLLAPISNFGQQKSYFATKKAVVFNLGGSLVPAMFPVISKYARQYKLTEAELTSKLFIDGDKELMDQVEPALLSRHGSNDANLANVISAIQSIRGAGLKTALITDAGDLDANLIPIENNLFDYVSRRLKVDMLNTLKVEPGEVVYLDNKEINIETAEHLGMTTINVESIEQALAELEKELKVPLKEFIPGFTWIFYNNANNPYKSTKENILFYFLCLYVLMVTCHVVVKHVLKIDGTFQR